MRKPPHNILSKEKLSQIRFMARSGFGKDFAASKIGLARPTVRKYWPNALSSKRMAAFRRARAEIAADAFRLLWSNAKKTSKNPAPGTAEAIILRKLVADRFNVSVGELNYALVLPAIAMGRSHGEAQRQYEIGHSQIAKAADRAKTEGLLETTKKMQMSEHMRKLRKEIWPAIDEYVARFPDLGAVHLYRKMRGKVKGITLSQITAGRDYLVEQGRARRLKHPDLTIIQKIAVSKLLAARPRFTAPQIAGIVNGVNADQVHTVGRKLRRKRQAAY